MPRSRVPDPLVPAPQVEQLLVAEPENAEYVELKAGLVEVIAMTEDLVDGHPDANAREAGAEAEGLITTRASPARCVECASARTARRPSGSMP